MAASARDHAVKVAAGARNRLEPGQRRFGQRPREGREKRGRVSPEVASAAVGPSPTDRGRAGTKRHQVVDRNGLPLATVLSGANVPDGQRLLAVLDAIVPVSGRRGRPRRRPDKVHADKAYDDSKLRKGLYERGIVPRLARRNVDSSQKLGRYRWVAERTFSWQQDARRLRIRDERRDDIYEAFVKIENALVCWGRLKGHYS